MILKFILILFLTVIYIFIRAETIIKAIKLNINAEKCYLSPDNSNLRIIHFIITRFMIKFWPFEDFPTKIFRDDYILNGIRVIKNYLVPSLENQSCRQFIWILKIGNKANKTYVESLLHLSNLFESKIIHEKDVHNYIRNKSKGFDILITTRIDYDDRIYYDAVNDVRKAININKPIILYGYNRGVHYYELDNKYYEFIRNDTSSGVMSIFASLILVLSKVNDTYNIYQLGTHMIARKKILLSYKSFGIKELNYEPAIYDSGDAKFVWVRQKFSGQYHLSEYIKKRLKEYRFNLSNFYGK